MGNFRLTDRRNQTIVLDGPEHACGLSSPLFAACVMRLTKLGAGEYDYESDSVSGTVRIYDNGSIRIMQDN